MKPSINLDKKDPKICLLTKYLNFSMIEQPNNY